MGRTSNALVVAAVGLTGLAACSAAADEAQDAAPDATTASVEQLDDLTAATDAPPSEGTVAEPDGGAASSAADALEQTGTLVIQATARVSVDDVTAAVDTISEAVTAAGGRVSAADVDHRPAAAGTPDMSTARLVLAVPPAELPGVVDAVRALGTMSGYDQAAEDVAEQLTDLDVRIANERASIDRVRALVEEAGTLQDLVFLESELTNRETQLETLLATQRNLVERVAMSTLTVELSAAPPAANAPAAGDEDDDRGVADALADGWDALAGAAFAVVFVLALLAPFLGVLAALAAVAFLVRRASGPRTRPSPSAAPASSPDAADTVTSGAGTASRPG